MHLVILALTTYGPGLANPATCEQFLCSLPGPRFKKKNNKNNEYYVYYC